MWEQKNFLTLEEAEAWKKDKDLRHLGFCPIINNDCNIDCVCYENSIITSLVGVSTKNTSVTGPGCSNPMITGFIPDCGA